MEDFLLIVRSRLISLGVLLCAFSAFAAEEQTQSFVYEGQLFEQDGVTTVRESVGFRFQIINTALNCILYEETQTGVDLSTTDGQFAVTVGSKLGSAKRSAGTSVNLTMAQVFKNTGTITPVAGCAAGYTPAAGDGRLLRVYVTKATGTEQLSPDLPLTSVPSALVAETLQGYSPAQLQNSTALQGTAIDPTLASGLTANDLLKWDGAKWVKTSITGLTAGACGAGKVLSFDGTNLTCVVDAGGGGTVTSVNGSGGAITISSGTTAVGNDINVATVGAAITINVPDASATVRGAVTTGAQTFAGAKTFSSAPTFSSLNNAGAVLFTNAGGTATQDAANLFWDDTANRMGLGEPAPQDRLHVTGQIRIDNDNNTANKGCFRFSGTAVEFSNDCASFNAIGTGTLSSETDPEVGANTTNYLSKWNGTALVTSGVFENGGNVGIGTNNPTMNNSGTVLHVHNSGTDSVAGASSVIHFTNGTTGSAGNNGFVLGRWGVSIGQTYPILWNYENTPIAFATNGAEAMRISAAGNVGIGTNNPGVKLDIFGAGATSMIRLGDNTTTSNAEIYHDIGNNMTFIRNVQGGSVKLKVAGTDVFVANGGANTLAGTLTATFGAGGIITDRYGVRTINSGSTFDTTAGALSNYGGHFVSASTRSAGANNLTNIGLYSSATGGQVNYAAIFDQGNVGIGTTTPGKNLEVKSATGDAARLYRNVNTVANGVNITFALDDSAGNRTDYAGVHGIIASNVDTAESGHLMFSTSTGGTLYEKLRVTSDGTLQWTGNDIGAVSSAGTGKIYYDLSEQKFKVSTNGGAYTDLAVGTYSTVWIDSGSNAYINGTAAVGRNSAAPANTQMQIDTQAVGNVGLVVNGMVGQTAHLLDLNVNGSNKFVVDKDGYVGIGVAAPTMPLDILGKVQFNPGVADSGTAVAYLLNTTNTLAANGAKIMSIQNNGAEIFKIHSTSGRIDATFNTAGYFNVGNLSATSVNSTSYSVASVQWMDGYNTPVQGVSFHGRNAFGPADGDISVFGGTGGTADVDGPHARFRGGSAGSGGAGNHLGGNVYIDGGAKTGSGTVGNILMGTVNASNVGIGTAVPLAKLHVEGASGGGGLFTWSKDTSTTGVGAFQARNDSNAFTTLATYGSANGIAAFRDNGALGTKNSLFAITDAAVANGGGGSINFLTGGYDPATQTRMVIDSTGKVGIGTATPNAKVEIGTTAGGTFTGLMISNVPAGTGIAPTQMEFSRFPTKTTAAITSDISAAGSFANGYLAFSTREAEVVTERMRITSEGKVAIGTESAASNRLRVTNVDPGTQTGAKATNQPALTANAAGNYHGSWGEMYMDSGAFTYAGVYGDVSRASTSATQSGAITTMTGGLNDAYHAGSAAISFANGSENLVVNQSTGVISSAAAGSFTVLNQGAGSVTTGYGVYIGSVQATNKWSVYALDATAPSYFNGSLTIGSATAPSGKVHIRTAADATIGLIVQANSATQSASLAEFRDSGGVKRSWVTKNGSIGTDHSGTTYYPPFAIPRQAPAGATSITSTTPTALTATYWFIPQSACRAIITAVFDVSTTTFSAGSVFVGDLVVYEDVTPNFPSGSAIYIPSASGERATVTQQWVYDISQAGVTHGIYINGKVNVAGATYNVSAGHTNVTLTCLGK